MPKHQSGRAAREAVAEPQRAKPAETQPVRGPSVRYLAPGPIIQRALAAPQTLRPADLMALQRTIGNHAVNALLDRSRPSTNLPDNLKVGIESLSGMPMDGVKVHYNSPQPAQVDALAYARGTDIHVAPGQEQQLPHEAWHVVQQLQGRVQPTLQLDQGVPVNDAGGLELEADLMGTKAAQMGRLDATPTGEGAVAAMLVRQTREPSEAPTLTGSAVGLSRAEDRSNFPSQQQNNVMPITQEMHGAAVVQRRIDFDRSKLTTATTEAKTFEDRMLYGAIGLALDDYTRDAKKCDLDTDLKNVKAILHLCKDLFKTRPKTTQTRSKSDLHLDCIYDLDRIARIEKGYLRSLQNYWKVIIDPLNEKLQEKEKLYFLSRDVKEFGIAAAAKIHQDIMGEIPLYLPEVASLVIFTLDDYKYMNPTTANDPAFLKTQSNLLKFRENAEKLLKARVETLFKEREATKHKAREDTKFLDPEHMPQKDKTPEQEREDLTLSILRSEGALHSGIMNKALEKLQPVAPIKVYRGARMSPTSFARVYPDLAKNTIREKYTVSNTIDKKIAQDYASGKGAQSAGDDKTLSVLCIQTAINGRDVSKISMLATEKEIVIPANSVFRVDSVEWQKRTAPGKIARLMGIKDSLLQTDIPNWLPSTTTQKISGKDAPNWMGDCKGTTAGEEGITDWILIRATEVEAGATSSLISAPAAVPKQTVPKQTVRELAVPELAVTKSQPNNEGVPWNAPPLPLVPRKEKAVVDSGTFADLQQAAAPPELTRSPRIAVERPKLPRNRPRKVESPATQSNARPSSGSTEGERPEAVPGKSLEQQIRGLVELAISNDDLSREQTNGFEQLNYLIQIDILKPYEYQWIYNLIVSTRSDDHMFWYNLESVVMSLQSGLITALEARMSLSSNGFIFQR